ncbi:PhzF family phenazine biosynthesis protein [Kitasatospora sp. NPDC015120]|uniref:PhzF family phenazine biosynthesis protein n=1 Tax=Kitasatospora sp. NPDC015120 TaxID=3364023 RepID=UPI0036F46428
MTGTTAAAAGAAARPDDDRVARRQPRSRTTPPQCGADPVEAGMEFELVEVFGSGPLTGGPLGVVLWDGAGDDALMQRLAARLAMPETVFLRGGDGGEVDVRIFTPYVELGFAGHPLVGAAAVAVRRRLAAPGWVTMRTRDGIVRARVEAGADGAVLEERICRVGPPVAPDLVCEAVGLAPDAAVGPVRWASAGLGFACLPVSAAGLRSAQALPLEVAALAERVPGLADVFGVAAFVPQLPDVRSRVFVPEPVCAEDPATGSAALAVAGWLAHQRRPEGPLAFDIVQGTAGLGFARMQVNVRGRAGRDPLASVGGAVRTLVRGQLALDGPAGN